MTHHRSREVTRVQLRRRGLTGGVVCAQLVARLGTTRKSCSVLWFTPFSVFNPSKTIEQSGDTDEEKAEDLIEAREPKDAAGAPKAK